MMRNSMQQVTTVHIHNICQSTCSALEAGVFLFLFRSGITPAYRESKYLIQTRHRAGDSSLTSKFREDPASTLTTEGGKNRQIAKEKKHPTHLCSVLT